MSVGTTAEPMTAPRRTPNCARSMIPALSPKKRRDGPEGETGAHELRCPRRSKPRRSHRPRRAWRLSADSTALDVDGDLLLSSVGTTRGRSVQAARPLPDAGAKGGTRTLTVLPTGT